MSGLLFKKCCCVGGGGEPCWAVPTLCVGEDPTGEIPVILCNVVAGWTLPQVFRASDGRCWVMPVNPPTISEIVSPYYESFASALFDACEDCQGTVGDCPHLYDNNCPETISISVIATCTDPYYPDISAPQCVMTLDGTLPLIGSARGRYEAWDIPGTVGGEATDSTIAVVKCGQDGMCDCPVPCYIFHAWWGLNWDNPCVPFNGHQRVYWHRAPLGELCIDGNATEICGIYGAYQAVEGVFSIL